MSVAIANLSGLVCLFAITVFARAVSTWLLWCSQREIAAEVRRFYKECIAYPEISKLISQGKSPEQGEAVCSVAFNQMMRLFVHHLEYIDKIRNRLDRQNFFNYSLRGEVEKNAIDAEARIVEFFDKMINDKQNSGYIFHNLETNRSDLARRLHDYRREANMAVRQESKRSREASEVGVINA